MPKPTTTTTSLLLLGATFLILGTVTYLMVSNSFDDVSFDFDTSDEDADAYS